MLHERAASETTIVIFDTEYTSWEGSVDRRWTGPGEYKEIIEIGAIRVVWPDGEVVGEFALLVKPIINPILSHYCSSLTGITQMALDQEGVSFDDALQRFCRFCGKSPTFSFGNDAAVIGENIATMKVDPGNFYGRNSPSFINIRFWIEEAANGGALRESGDLWKQFGGVEPIGFDRGHSALSDCYSLLAAIRHIYRSGRYFPA
jgi:hypothetical protein